MSRIAAGLLIWLLWSCNSVENPPFVKSYETYCGSCHLSPGIDQLPRNFWTEQLLPDMGARMGIKTPGYDPMKGMTFEEMQEVVRSGIYPLQPQIPEKIWQDISAYIEQMAPDSLRPIVPMEIGKLPHYQLREIRHPKTPLPSITYLKIVDQKIQLGDTQGGFWTYDPKLESWENQYNFESPVTSFIQHNTRSWALTVGILDPSEQSRGKLLELSSKGSRILIDSLHRPVNMNMIMLDNQPQFLIAEFGHLTGQLSAFSQHNSDSVETIISTPGALRSVQADIDGDGVEEWLILFAQGDERLLALRSDSNGYDTENLLRFSPLSGVSWFEVTDMDLDGDKDIITVHGDNADHTYLQKPYHGVRIYTNDGDGNFNLAMSYPMNGATRVVTTDWDLDGDTDLAVIAAFPDYQMTTPASFIVLENLVPEQLKFESNTIEDPNTGRWFLMDAGDLDGDGDQDLVLSVFNYNITPVPIRYLDKWQENPMAFIILENTRESLVAE